MHSTSYVAILVTVFDLHCNDYAPVCKIVVNTRIIPVSKMATVKLASGKSMPLVGFGLWKVPADTAADTVYNAITTGYRLFDGAYDYAK